MGRAVIPAIAMKQDINDINCGCKIGISTGCTFSDAFGTSGSRREYSAIGNYVNLAIRLMQIACKNDQHFFLQICYNKRQSRQCQYKLPRNQFGIKQNRNSQSILSKTY